MANETQPSIADIFSALASKQTASTAKEKNFENYTIYFNEIYIGNYSLPSDFSDTTKASVLKLFETLGIKLLTPGSTKKDIDFSAFGIPTAKK